MPAFEKFDPHAFLKSENREGTPAKVANPAKVWFQREKTLATLATLADGHLENRDSTPAPETAPDADEFAERAAIIEYEAGAPRPWAEALARLDPDLPPADVPLKRWQRFIDDCSRFLDCGWAARAKELGWTPLDLFGCDRERPFARIDRLGLLWLVNGDRLVALTADAAAIETRGGVRHTYHRRPVEPGHVMLAWELAS